MSITLLEQTKIDIEEAYENDNLIKMEKETLFVFGQVFHLMLSVFSDRLKGITFSKDGNEFDEDFLSSKKNMQNLLKILKCITSMKLPASDLNFGKLKIDVERWYNELGGEEMHFEYHEQYLLTPKEAAKQLNISTVTLNKYVKQGFEVMDTTSHHKVPKHAVLLWQDPVYAIRMQMLAQEKKLRHQTPEERLKELLDEITELQNQYNVKTISEAFTKYEIIDLDLLDDPADFRKWADLEEEKEMLMKEMIEGS